MTPFNELDSMNNAARLTGLRAVLHGAIGFGLVSVIGFSVWAFLGKYLSQRIGEVGFYLVSASVFMVAAGLLLHPLAPGPRALLNFYKAFTPAFLVYAALWSVCWFAWGFGVGEWIGSVVGCTAFALVLRQMLGSRANPLPAILVLSATHALGYFLGEIAFMGRAHGTPRYGGLTQWQTALLAKLLYGLTYGLGFGAGIGFAFARFRPRTANPSS